MTINKTMATKENILHTPGIATKENIGQLPGNVNEIINKLSSIVDKFRKY